LFVFSSVHLFVFVVIGCTFTDIFVGISHVLDNYIVSNCTVIKWNNLLLYVLCVLYALIDQNITI